MKEIELNLENLFNLGLTSEILKNDFENWVCQNNDIIIDFEKKIIYYDIIKYKEELDNLLNITKNDLMNDGLSKEEIEAFLDNERKDSYEGFQKVLNELSESGKQEFLHHIIPKLKDQLLECKTQYYDRKLSDILKTKNVRLQSLGTSNSSTSDKKNTVQLTGTVIETDETLFTDITYLNGLFSENKDILPQSIINAYNSIGNIKSLYITKYEGEIINTYEDDLDPFENVCGTKIIEYYCIESNYLNLLSKIDDSTFVFFDNLPIDLYLYEYAKAFILGYSEFETILNQNQTLITDTQEQKALKIFSYVLNAKYKNGYFGGDYENIEELKNKKGMYVANEDMYDWGYKGGQFYKAWEIILNNPLIFEPLFEKFITPKSIDETIFEEKNISTDNENNNLMLDQIDRNLSNWLRNYESKNEYLPIPLAIEEKADYVVDTYKNYEERNFKYQLEICNIILEKVPNEELIIGFKKEYEKKIIDLRKEIPLPNVNIETVISDINNAFYRLENFMKGSVSVYQSFLFNDAFTIFFNELNKIENITVKNHDLRDGYYHLLSQIDYAHDKSEFKNHDAYKNDDFNRDCNEICYIHFYRSLEFGISNDLDDYKFEMPSILDIIKPSNSTPEIINIDFEDKLSITDEENLYPRIFTSHKGFDKFKKLREEFGNTKQNLSNYSFVYHRMVKDKFIFEDYKQTEFVFFLLNFDINISRIKPKTQLGNNDLRESIYNSVK